MGTGSDDIDSSNKCCFTHSTWHYAQRSQSWKWSDVKKRYRAYATVDPKIRCNVYLFAPHYCVTILFYFYSAVVFAFFYRLFLFFKYDFQYARASCASHAVVNIARPITWAAHLRKKQHRATVRRTENKLHAIGHVAIITHESVVSNENFICKMLCYSDCTFIFSMF